MIFSPQGHGDQPCSAPNCLEWQLWFSRAWNLEQRCQARFPKQIYHNLYLSGTSCSVCSTMWTMRTRWYFEGCNYHFDYCYHYFYKVAFRGMQALNTSGILELMENLGAAGECQVPFGQIWDTNIKARFPLVKDINLLVVSILTSGSFVESTSKLLQNKR